MGRRRCAPGSWGANGVGPHRLSARAGPGAPATVVLAAIGSPPIPGGEDPARRGVARRAGARAVERVAGNDDRPAGGGAGYACLVSQKILSISAILSSSSCALPASSEPFVPVAPASLVASLKSWCSSGYFSKCGGLK